MARVTVEDCVDKVPNRFDLVLLAGYRARKPMTRQTKSPRERRSRPPLAP